METSGCIVVSSNCLQPSNYQGLEVLFTSYVTYPIPAGGGCDCNRSNYYYLVWKLFK